MTRQLAFDFSHENIKIRVNGIAPGTSTHPAPSLNPPSQTFTYILGKNEQISNKRV